MTRSIIGRLAIVAVLLAGVMASAAVLPASAHISGVAHTWSHFKPKVETMLSDRSPWAVVGSSGALVRGSGAGSSTKAGTGTYVVTFSRDISSCSYTATSLDTASGSSAVYARIEVGAANSLSPNQIRVGIVNTSTASLVDFGFSLQVMC
jgi:hypothetical protein